MFISIGRPKNILELKTIGIPYKGTDRERIPIAVIDDEPFEYLDILRHHDFNIKTFNDITDIKAVHTYAIVLCDIKGIGKAFNSKFEGAHIISEMRKYYPAKIIIAYSGHQFDPSYNKYFQMSDFVLKKDIDSDDWIEKLDEALRIAVDPINQWYRIRDYLLSHEIPLYTLLKLEDEYVKRILNNTSKFPSDKILTSLPQDVKTVLLNFTSSILFKILIGS